MKIRKQICIDDNLIITLDNVQTIGEKIAVSAIRKRLRFDSKYLKDIYHGLIRDLNHSVKNNETISNGYDVAQEAICFLCNFLGHKLGEICIKNIHGGYDCIRLATFKIVYNYLRKQVKSIKENEFDFDMLNNYLVDIDIEEDFNYANTNRIIRKLNLTQKELSVLKYCYNQMTYTNISEILHIDRKTISRRKQKIREKYLALLPI